jgi:hypothetical protein
MTKWIACLYDGKTKTAQYEGAKQGKIANVF